jgi:hypothetical protein
MQKLIVTLLLTALMLPAQTLTLNEQIASVRVHSPVKIRLLSGAEVRGRLVRFDDERVVISVESGNTFADRTYELSQVKWFKENKPLWVIRAAKHVGFALLLPFLLLGFILSGTGA